MRVLLMAALIGISTSRGDVVTQWDFNSANADSDPATGKLEPSTGQGIAAIVGGVTQSFGSVASGATSDPATGDNTQLRLGGFPAQGTANKGSGLEFRASTVGFQNIRFVWDQENSGTASRFWRIQYSLDGSLWTDHEVFANGTAGSWLLARTIGFYGIAGANDNPNFGVRIVSEFDESTGEYRAVNATGNYSTAGTFWIDMVSIQGDVLGSTNVPPVTDPKTMVARWDFNASTPGNMEPAIPVGGTSLSFGTVGGGATSDPADGNSMARVTGFPPRTEANKTAGVEFRASTAGFKNLKLSWDQYNSNTGSRYWRIQYTINGTDFLDHTFFSNTAPSVWHRENGVDFTSLPGANDNPSFAIRMVAEFESTATGGGEDAYDAVNETSTYSANGTLWLDFVTLLGEAFTSTNLPNSAPAITEFVPITGRAGASIGPVAFTIHDAETPAEELILSASSDNPALLRDFTFGGTGTNRNITLQLNPEETGSATITIVVTDPGGRSARTTLPLIILPEHTPPSISVKTKHGVRLGSAPFSIEFTVADGEQSGELLTITTQASDPELVSFSGMIVEGLDSIRKLRVTPEPGKLGGSRITLTVSDGMFESSADIDVQVVPAEIITIWNFNEPHAAPLLGEGTFQAIGSLNSSFASLASGSSDPTTQSNMMFRLSSFPGQGNANKLAGAEFRASTSGRRNITLAWEQQNSGTASRYWRLQCSTNGADFFDHIVHTNTRASAWTKQVVSLAGLAGVDDNPAFAVRLVSEFESTATGAGVDAYASVSQESNYGGTGTLWLDLVTLSGEIIPGPNSPPILSDIANHLVRENTPTGPLSFNVYDDQTEADALVLTAISSNTGLVTEITFGGAGTNRTVVLRPNLSQSGQAQITIRATDSEGLFGEKTFTLTVLQQNTAPTISPVANRSTAGELLRIPFTVADREQASGQLNITVQSTRNDLADLVVEGTGTDRELVITPQLGRSGVSTIMLLVSDGLVSSVTQFELRVVPIDPPSLNISVSGGDLLISWSVSSADFTLERATGFLEPNWQQVSETPSQPVRLPISEEKQFFRLKQRL